MKWTSARVLEVCFDDDMSGASRLEQALVQCPDSEDEDDLDECFSLSPSGGGAFATGCTYRIEVRGTATGAVSAIGEWSRRDDGSDGSGNQPSCAASSASTCASPSARRRR